MVQVYSLLDIPLQMRHQPGLAGHTKLFFPVSGPTSYLKMARPPPALNDFTNQTGCV